MLVRLAPIVSNNPLLLAQPLTEKVDIYRMGVVFASIIAAKRDAAPPSKTGGAIALNPAWHEGYVKVGDSLRTTFADTHFTLRHE